MLTELTEKYRDIRNSSDSRKLRLDVWLQAFLKATGKSQYALEDFLSKHVGRYGPDRIRYLKYIKNGNKPKRNKSNPIDVIEKLHLEYGQLEIKLWFNSPFWIVISDGFYGYASHPEKIRIMLAEFIEIARLNSVALGEKNYPARYFEFEEPLRRRRIKPAKKRFRIPNFLLGPSSFDNLAVLAVLYREAYIGCSINYAAQIRSLFLEKFYELLNHQYIGDNLKDRLFDISINKIMFPIRQTRRRASKNLEASYKLAASTNDRSPELMSYIKSHDKAIKNP